MTKEKNKTNGKSTSKNSLAKRTKAVALATVLATVGQNLTIPLIPDSPIGLQKAYAASAPTITATATPGTAPSTTAIAATPGSGNHLAIQVSSATIAAPATGAAAPTGATVTNPYASGTNITGVDPNVNKYIGVYELSSTNTVVSFTLITLTTAMVSASPTNTAVSSVGTVAGSTAINYTVGTGNHLVTKVSSTPITQPYVNDAVPTGTGVTNPYTNGANLTGVDPTTNKYVGVYEANSSNKVVSFSQATLTTANIAVTALTNTVAVGTAPGTTEVTATPQPGDHLVVQVSSSPVLFPSLASAPPSGIGVTSNYVSGQNISGVDINTNKYLGVYEVNGSNQIINFAAIALTSTTIATASGLVATATQGSTPSTTDINATVSTGHTLAVKVSSTSITAPSIGSPAPTGTGVTNPYTSGANLGGVDSSVNKYVGVYDIDGNGNVYSFTQLTLTNANISPVSNSSFNPTAAPGTAQGTTAVTGSVGTGNHLVVKVSSTSIATPSVGDAVPTGTGVTNPYTSGANISGVDIVTNKYLGVYEANASNQVVNFKQLTLDQTCIDTQSITATAAAGATPGSTKITVAPGTGNHIVAQVTSSPVAVPAIKSQAPSGTGIISLYNSGTDIVGVDPYVNKYVAIYEVDSQNEVVSFNQITLTTSTVATAPTLTATPSPGSTPGSTDIAVTPNGSDTIVIKVSSATIATPYLGDAAPTGAGVTNPYTPGANITGVDATTNKYVGVYDINPSGTVTAFKLITLVASNISAPYAITFTAAKGTVQGSTAITTTPGTGNTITVKVASASIATPNVGDAAPTGTGVTASYVNGANITGVDSVTNKYLGVYEINSTGKVVSFNQTVLGSSNINTPLLSATIAAGSVSNSIKITATPNTGDRLVVQVASSPVTQPNIGDTSPTGSSVTDPYTSGANITTADPVTNKYLCVYDINSSNQVVSFNQTTLTSASFSSVPTTNVTQSPGQSPSSTSLNGTIGSGNTLAIKVSSATITAPKEYDPAPTGTGITNPYTLGSDITGVDSVTNKYLGVYELNSSGQVVSFKLITLATTDINTVASITATAAPGTSAGTTAITATPGTGNHLVIKVSSTAITSPSIGTAVPTGTGVTNPYTSGANISGVDSVTNKYIGVYEANSSNLVVSFTQITLTSSTVLSQTAPALTNTVAKGVTGGSTKITATSATGNHLEVIVSPTSIPTPNLCDPVPTGTGVITPYTSGADIPGVDPVNNKYVGLYDVTPSGTVASFSLITLGIATIQVPTTVAVQSPGSTPNSTSLAYTVATGNTVTLKIASTAITAPNIGDVAPTGGASVTTNYVSGADILGVDETTNKYLGVYEVNSTGNVVSFKLITLAPTDIASAYSLSASQAIGVNAGATAVTATVGTGNHIVIKVSATSIANPNVGDAVPTGTGVTNPYTSGADITGVDAVNNKYIGVYEANASNKVVSFKQIIANPAFINAPTITVTQAAGIVPNTTTVSGTPITGDTYAVQVSSSPIAIPTCATAVAGIPGIINPYTSGSNISGVDNTVNKYVGVYEVNSNGTIDGFKLLTVTGSISGAPTLAVTQSPGTDPSTAVLNVSPINSGDSITLKVSSSTVATPNVGDAGPTGFNIINNYVSGTEVSGADTSVNKYIGVYELDTNGKVVAFSLVTLLSGSLASVPSLVATAAPGSGYATTKVTASIAAGDTVAIKVSNTTITSPNLGDVVTGAYTMGTDITQADPTNYKYIGVYELSPSGKVVKFSQLTLDNTKFNSINMLSATVSPSTTVAGSTTINITPRSGYYTEVQVSSSPLPVPTLGYVPAGLGTYTSGGNISNVDAVNNKYVMVYEVNSNYVVTGYQQIILTASNISITPPSLTPAPGSAPNTVKLVGTVDSGTVLLAYATSYSTDGNLPAVGSLAPGIAKPYSLGADLAGADPVTNRYIRVFEVNSTTNAIVKYGLIVAPSSSFNNPNKVFQYINPSFNNYTRAITTSDGGYATVYGTALTKFDSCGNVQWIKQFPNASVIYNISQTSTGFVIAGIDSAYNVYTAKLDNTGNIIWENKTAPITGTYFTDINFIDTNSSGITTIVSSSMFTYANGSGSTIATDPFVVQIDSNGNTLTQKHYRGIGSGYEMEELFSVKRLQNGDLILNASSVGAPPSARIGAYAIILDTNLNVLNTLYPPNIGAYVFDTLELPNHNLLYLGANGIAITSPTGVLQTSASLTLPPPTTAGWREEHIFSTPDGGYAFSYRVDSYQIGLVKLDSSCNIQWTKQLSLNQNGVPEGLYGVVGNDYLICGNLSNKALLELIPGGIPTINVTLSQGTAISTISASVTPVYAGDTLVLRKSSSTPLTPSYGDSFSPNAGDISNYTSGSDIPVNASTDTYLSVYEIDSNNNIKAFNSVSITTSQITQPAATLNVVLSQGDVAGSTRAIVAPNTAGDVLAVKVVATPTSTPVYGTKNLPVGLTQPYSSGSDITGVDIVTNKYVDVYELNSSGQIVSFGEAQVGVSTVYGSGALTIASPIDATLIKGTSLGTTAAHVNLINPGDTIAIKVTSSLASTPNVGDIPPSGSVNPYVSGADISGVDTSINKYVNVYELNSGGTIIGFKQLEVSSDTILQPTSAPFVNASLQLGSTTGTTAANITPMNTGDTLAIGIGSISISTPNVGDLPPSGIINPYLNMSDISGIDSTTNKYVNVYELNSSGKIVDFNQLTVNNSVIKQAPNQAPALSATLGRGIASGSVEVSSDSTGIASFAVKVNSIASGVVYTGGTLPTGVTDPYTLGSDISGVDTIVNKYVDVYGLNSNNNVIAFKEFIVTTANISTGVNQVPGLTTLVSKGSTVGTTAVSAVPLNPSDTFEVSVSSTGSQTPNVGDLISSTSAQPYTLGADISGVDAVINKFVNIYEVDSTGKIIGFSAVTLTPSNIGTASTSISAPQLNVTQLVGSTVGTTKLNIIPNSSGDTIAIKVSSSLDSIPYVGDSLPTGVLEPYTIGADISGVDPTTNKYINVYEVDSNNKIVAFKQIALSQSDIKQASAQAPTLNASIGQGQASGTAEVTATSTGTDHLAVKVSSVSAGIVSIGDSVPGGSINPYTSGSDITGVDAYTNKYVDVYGLDNNNNVVAFKEFELTDNDIAPPASTTPPTMPAVLQPGTTDGAITVISVPNAGDHLAIKISSSSLVQPKIGDDMSSDTSLTNPYISGSPVPTVSAGETVGVYELDSNNKVVAFSMFTVTPEDVTPPTNPIAQDPSLAVVAGFLQTASGAPLVNVPVTLHSTPETVYTDSNGYFVFNNVPHATHTLSVPDTVVSQYSNIKMAIATDSGVNTTTGTGTVSFTLNSGNATVSTLMADPINTVVTAHSLSAVAVKGSTANTTAVAVVPLYSNDTIAIKVGTTVVPTPNEGDSLPSGVVNNYQSMTDVSDVDATTNKYISVYEVDTTGKIVAFTQLTLSASQISTAPTVTNSTRLVVMTSSDVIPTPVIGSPEPIGSNVTDPYVPGQPVNGISTANYMGMYQIDSNNKVVSFSLIPVAINISLSVSPGSKVNTTQANIASVNGNTITAQVMTASSNVVATGNQAPTGAGVISNYVSGTDIPVASQDSYLAMYEVSNQGYVVASKVVPLDSSEINQGSTGSTGSTGDNGNTINNSGNGSGSTGNTGNNTGGSTGNNSGGGTGSSTGGNTGNNTGNNTGGNTGDGSGTGTGNNTGDSGTGSGSGSGDNSSGNGSSTGTSTGTTTQQGTVTIKYINSATGTNILQPVNNTVALNTSFTANAANISGYSLSSGCSATQSVTPTAQNPNMTITFSYTQEYFGGGGGGGGYISTGSTTDGNTTSNTTGDTTTSNGGTTTTSTTSAGITRVYDSEASSTVTIAKDAIDSSTQAIVITSDISYADGLSGSALAAKYHAPIIELHADGNNDDIYQYLSTISPDMQIFILGQTGVVSADSETKIKTMFHKVTRLGGADRFETSLKINEYLGFAKGKPLFVASGEDFADALSVGAISAIKQMPVLLVQKDNIPDSTLEELEELQPSEVFIAGGTGVVSSAVENMIEQITNTTVIRLGGADRYKTSLLVAGQFETNTNEDVYVTGKDFKDALSAEALAAKNKADLILIDNDDYAEQVKDSRDKGFVVGSTDTISDDVMNDLENGNVDSTPSTNPTGAIINKKSIISKIASLFKKNI